MTNTIDGARNKSLAGMAMLLLAAIMLLLAPFAHAADDFLDPEAAFKFSARMIDAKTAEGNYAIADGYYMYRERFHFTADNARLGTPVFLLGLFFFVVFFLFVVVFFFGF